MTTTESGLLTAFLTFGGVVLGWLIKSKKIEAEAKKTRTEAEGGELDNVEKAIKIWRELAEDIKEDMASLQKQYNQLSERYQWLEGEHKIIIKENESLKEKIRQLEKRTENL